MTGIIDLLVTAPDEAAAKAMLEDLGWVGLDEEDSPVFVAPFSCAIMPIVLWRRTAKQDEEGVTIDAGETAPGFWLGLCIPDASRLEELQKLLGYVAALDRNTGKIIDLKGFTLEQVNALETITPVWAGSVYKWGNLRMF